MGIPFFSSMAKVSRALCPMASTTAPASMRSPFSQTTPRTLPPSITSSVTLVEKRTSPPQERIRSRMCFTTRDSTSVPTWGLLSYRISSGAPFSTKIFRTSVFLPSLSFTSVFSLPSEKVPAPPSPNCTLESAESTPVFQNSSTRLVRLSTSAPRSRSNGRYPAFASRYPQKSPAGPVPMMSGLSARISFPGSGKR